MATLSWREGDSKKGTLLHGANEMLPIGRRGEWKLIELLRRTRIPAQNEGGGWVKKFFFKEGKKEATEDSIGK